MRLLTLRSVLVAVDLDDPSQSAFRTAARLASLAGAALHLVHVTDTSIAGGAARLRERFRQACPEGPEPASAELARGDASGAIVGQAARVGADVVVLGPHRHRAGHRGELGSTAAGIVRTSPCACLVTASEVSLPLERVVVAVDASPAAGGVLLTALSWASALRPRGAAVRVSALHVSPDADPSAGMHVREAVQGARQRAGGAPHVEMLERVVRGSLPAEEILRHASSDSADLLVVGTRGAASGSPGMGSVSAAVARTTPCPLLLVPPAVWAGTGP